MLRLKVLRKEKNINQQKLAMIFQISQASISKYEIGLAEPDIEMIIRMAKYFNVSTDYILGYSDIRNTLSKRDLTDEEIDHLLSYKKLLPEQREKVIAYIQGILNEKISKY